MTAEQNARAYLEAIGLDPDEVVVGCEWGVRHRRPRWAGMLGATPALAVGSTAVSPRQRALLAGGGRA